jgi:membrane protease YdiL (CAAX protease family)
MLKQFAYSSLLALGGLIAVYAPTFVLTSLLISSGSLGTFNRNQAQLVAVPLVIVISAGIALVCMAVLARRAHLALDAYGFKRAGWRCLVLALGLGLASALGLRGLRWVLPIHPSFDMGELRTWQIALFFWVGAPIQEEMIFRGLLQSVVQRRQPVTTPAAAPRLPVAVLVSALLFAAVHIATGRLGASPGEVAFIVFGAFVLGIVAGWLRWKSGSLLPGILVHALFNMLLS